MVAKQRDAPLELIEARRRGDELHDAASKGAPTLAVVLHQLDTLFVRQGEPVGALLASLRHRVETERVLALGRKHRIQTWLQHLGRHVLRVFADLGDRDVAVAHGETRNLHPGL